MQAKIEDTRSEEVEIIREKIMEDLSDLERLLTPYFIQLIWKVLKDRRMTLRNGKEGDLSGPNMVKRLVQILLLNREADKAVIDKVRQALLEWEE